MSSSSLGCSCRISIFMVLSSFFSVVIGVVKMVGVVGLGVVSAVSSEFFVYSLLLLLVQVAIFCDNFSVALLISML